MPVSFYSAYRQNFAHLWYPATTTALFGQPVIQQYLAQSTRSLTLCCRVSAASNRILRAAAASTFCDACGTLAVGASSSLFPAGFRDPKQLP